MTQEQLKAQFLQYAENNLNNDKTLEAIAELLDNIGSELYGDGYTKQANALWTCKELIQDVLESEGNK